MLFLSKRSKVLLAILAVVVVIISGTLYLKSREDIEITDVQEKEPVASEASVTPTEVPVVKDIVVYVCGTGIKHPQNVTLKEGARVEDAIIAAGGALKEADLNQLNLAHILTDQEKVYVPRKGETIAEQSLGGANDGSGASPGSSVVNINTATAEQLDTLPGVGPSTAQKIISYRKANGGFKSIEDLKNVSGIGDSKFEDLKGLVTIN